MWRWDSDAFGNGLANSNPGGVMQFEFNIRFPGQVFDAESGLYYNNARYYDPVTGRYISSDPIGLAGGINTYGYVEGNPLSLVDITGLFKSPAWMRLLVPGQIAWDSALTAIESKNYSAAVVSATTMIGEVAITAVSFGAGSTASIVGKSCPSPVTVTSWADAGIAPELSPNRRVQLGEGSKLDFWKTGLPGGKGAFISEFPYIQLTASAVPFENRVTREVLDNSLMWPPGWNAVRGLCDFYRNAMTRHPG